MPISAKCFGSVSILLVLVTILFTTLTSVNLCPRFYFTNCIVSVLCFYLCLHFLSALRDYMVLLMQGSVALLNYLPSSVPLNHYLASSQSQNYICFVLFGLFSLANFNFRIDSSPLMFALCASVSVCELKYAHCRSALIFT